MKSPTNLRGVLAWAVAGAMWWYQTPEGLNIPETIEETTQKSRDKLDTIGRFLEEYTIKDADAFIIGSTLYGVYQSWCKYNGEGTKQQKAFKDALERRGYQTKQKKQPNGRNLRSVIGLRLMTIDNFEPEDETRETIVF